MSTRPFLGTNVNAASIEEMRYRGLIDEGETLLAIFDGVLLDENRRRVGGLAISDFVALTDRRVITWARGFFNDTVDSFVWQDVDVVQAETWDPWHGRVQLAFRLPPVAPRRRRIAINGSYEEPGSGERLVINTLDYMPADDVTIFARMVECIGDQIVGGLSGEALAAAFFEAFPPVEREPLQPFFTPAEPAPPPPAHQPETGQAPARKRWWQVGRAGEEQHELTPPASPANLIAAYESARGGAPAGSGGAPMAQMGPAGPLPTLPEAPNMYEVSRSLRLVLEAPRRLVRGFMRATEAMGGANELVQGLQDPRVRRNAMRGLYATAAQHEAAGGPLAPVGPVVRAAVRFAEPLEEEQAEQQSRRIQVRASVRKAPTPIEPEGVEPQQRAPRQAPPAAASSEADAQQLPVRRSISVRRVEPPEGPAETPAAPFGDAAGTSEADAQRLVQQASTTPRAAPVRRIAVSRGERPDGPEMSLVSEVRTQRAPELRTPLAPEARTQPAASQRGVQRPDGDEA